jgi:hypothetical protein
MVSVKQYRSLEEAAKRYLSDADYGVAETADLMTEIFGEDRAGTEAAAWSSYWTQLNIYEEALREGHVGDVPMASRLSIQVELWKTYNCIGAG